MKNDPVETATVPLALTTAQIIQISMTLPSVYVNNVVYASTAGGMKVTFVETTYEGALSPRVTVFMPAELVRQFYNNLGEFIKRAEATASSPQAPTTRQ